MSIQSLTTPILKKVLDYLNDDDKYKLFIASGRGMFYRCYGINKVEKLFYEARVKSKIFKIIKSYALISDLVANGYNLKSDLENIRTTFLNQLHAMKNYEENNSSAYFMRDIKFLLTISVLLNINTLLTLSLMMHPESDTDAAVKVTTLGFGIIVDMVFLLKAIDSCREKSRLNYLKAVIQKVTKLQYHLNRYIEPVNNNQQNIEEKKSSYEMV